MSDRRGELEIFTFEQGSDEWLRARMGIPTASEFDTVMAKGKGSSPSKTRRTYMLKLIGERLTGEPMWKFSNEHMERGKEMEAEARAAYALIRDVEPIEVGFMRYGEIGASPDSLVGEEGLLEIKTKLPHLHLECMLGGKIPPEHRAQCQGQLLVSGREWVDFVSYWPGLTPFIVREHRDEEYMKTISDALEQFLADMAETMEQIGAYRVTKEAVNA